MSRHRHQPRHRTPGRRAALVLAGATGLALTGLTAAVAVVVQDRPEQTTGPAVAAPTPVRVLPTPRPAPPPVETPPADFTADRPETDAPTATDVAVDVTVDEHSAPETLAITPIPDIPVVEETWTPAPEPVATWVEPAVQEPAWEPVAVEPEPILEEPAAAPVEPLPVLEPAPAPVGGSILDVAASYVGYPYALGATPPAAFDCSSYTSWVYAQVGITIPRSVDGQRAVVTPVTDPQPGDLIFYNDFYHVGIYAGPGMTYEAANPDDGVRYGPMFSTNVWYGRVG